MPFVMFCHFNEGLSATTSKVSNVKLEINWLVLTVKIVFKVPHKVSLLHCALLLPATPCYTLPCSGSRHYQITIHEKAQKFTNPAKIIESLIG